MIKKSTTVQGIPVCVWGKSSKRVIIAIHGEGSHKEDAIIAILARIAVDKGAQVLSFDLPGDEKNIENGQDIEQNINVLQQIMEVAKKKWQKIGVFAYSISAYYALQAYQEESQIDYVYFLSPILDLFEILDEEMQRNEITEEQLELEQEIETKNAMLLDWHYYTYVKEHQKIKWEHPTYILYGKEDKFQSIEIVKKFATEFQSKLKLIGKNGHYFNTKESLKSYCEWLEVCM